MFVIIGNHSEVDADAQGVIFEVKAHVAVLRSDLIFRVMTEKQVCLAGISPPQ